MVDAAAKKRKSASDTFPGEERRGRGIFLAADVQKRRAALRQQINKLNARGPKDG